MRQPNAMEINAMMDKDRRTWEFCERFMAMLESLDTLIDRENQHLAHQADSTEHTAYRRPY